MKTLIRSKKHLILILGLMVFSLLFVTTAMACHYCKYYYHHYYGYAKRSPIAVCTTNTSAPLPAYSCCQLRNPGHYNKHGCYVRGSQVWGNTWVSGVCQNANAAATRDYGCSVSSPVFGTNSPIVANCQFSYSTGEH